MLSPQQYATLFVVDPSGKALEFKAFRNHDQVFSKIFDPATRDISGLEELAADAAAGEGAQQAAS